MLLTFRALALRRRETSLVFNITVRSQYKPLYFASAVSTWENYPRISIEILLRNITNPVVLLPTVLMVYSSNSLFLSRNYRLIAVPPKFDVLKTNIYPKSEAPRANMLVLKTLDFQLTTITPIVPSDT